MLVIAALVVSLMEPGNLGWIVAGLIAAGVVQALIGIYEFRGGSGSPDLWILDFHYFRAFGSFGQPNPFCAWIGLALALPPRVAGGGAEQTPPPNPSPTGAG